MKKKILITAFIIVAMVCMFAVGVSAVAPAPQKPTLDVSFGDVTTIPDFVAPSELYLNTDERVLLVDENGNYVTYPTYYVTKNQETFDFDFSKLNAAQSIQYDKKCVVMLEIPDGVTTISNSYFAGTGNFPKCVSVQFPGSVTSYGSSLFAGYNSVIESVEFLDGTDPITLGDSLFGSQWNGGTTNLKYVKFPNNCVSIGNNTFGKSLQSKTIILGANLKSVGTGFFSQSTPADKDTFVYASTNFFADTAMFSNLFGSYDQWHNNQMRITLFYTGTQAEAQAFIDKGAAVGQTGYLWDTAVTLVSASDYVYETHKPAKDKGLTMVYDYNVCDAFYNSVHEKNAPYYEFEGEEYISNLNECVACSNCGDTIKTKVVGPVFTSRGYSKNEAEGSFMYDIVVNYEAKAIYEEKTGSTLTFGLVVSADTKIDKLINEDESVVSNDVLRIRFLDVEYTKLQVKFTNVGANSDLKVHACAYVIENNDDAKTVSYIGNGITEAISTPISYGEIPSNTEE